MKLVLGHLVEAVYSFLFSNSRELSNYLHYLPRPNKVNIPYIRFWQKSYSPKSTTAILIFSVMNLYINFNLLANYHRIQLAQTLSQTVLYIKTKQLYC